MKFMRYFLALIFSIYFSSIFGNNSKVDSLFMELKYANDSVKYTIYDELISILKNRNIDSACLVTGEAMEIAKNNNNLEKIASYSVSFGMLYEHKGEIEKSINNFEQAYNLYLKIDNVELASTALSNLGAMLNDAGRYNEASKNLFRALNLAEENQYVKLKASIYNNIGLLFYYQNEWEKSIEYFQKAIKINHQLKNLNSMALLYNNIGISYYYLAILDSVLISFERSLDIYIELDDKKGQTRPLFNIAEVYSEKGDFTKALEYYERSLKIEKEIGYMSGYATSLVYIGKLYSNLGDSIKALKYQYEGIDILKKLDIPHDLMDAYSAISKTYKKNGFYDSALHYQTIMISLKDSLFSLEKAKQISELETVYETEKKEQQIALQRIELQNKSKQNISLSIILILAIGIIIYALITIKKRRNINTILREKNRLLSLQNEKITNSINYAHLIQTSILPPKQLFDIIFPESFIFFKPKDIISGDFYWITELENKVIVALADCTGHGVPGAFMSMLGISFLKEIIDFNKVSEPHIILNSLREKIMDALRQKEHITNTIDGMDISVCTINTKTKEFEYSGAYLPILFYSGGKATEIKPDRMPISYHKIKTGSFSATSYSYKSGDILYFYSDGFADQFGGEDKKKYSIRKFRSLIENITFLPLDDQKWVFEKELSLWQGDQEQIDDITILGIKL